MMMPDRNYDAEEYRYGFNTQEKVPELNSSHTTALFWEYDGRLGRRWNLDPIVKSNKSSYSVLSDNPIIRIDLSGDDDYLDMEGNHLYNDGEGNNLRLISKEQFSIIKSFVNKTAQSQNFEAETAKNEYTMEQMRASLRNTSRIITIQDDEIKGIPDGTTTIDFLYDLTNDSKKNPFGEKEYYANIYLNTKDATISFVNVGSLYYNGGTFWNKRNEYVVLANIHGHPDTRIPLNERMDTNKPSGYSLYDRNAAQKINGPVFNIESDNVYYYTPYQTQNEPFIYQGSRDAGSIIHFVIDIKINK